MTSHDLFQNVLIGALMVSQVALAWRLWVLAKR